MKIKHWQGYGCVIAKKIDRKINGNEIIVAIGFITVLITEKIKPAAT